MLRKMVKAMKMKRGSLALCSVMERALSEKKISGRKYLPKLALPRACDVK
jgi:hypothetical protein